MKTIFLFLVCFICVRVGQNSAAAALCESTVASRGDVYEFAPNNFTVIEVLNFEGTNGDNIELTFSSGDLDKYFKIVNDSLVVANSAALTRNEISPSGYVIEGVINCKVISTGDTGLTGDVEVDFHYTNMYNPVFTSENKTIVSENEPIGKTVVTLETTDEDNDALATPIYSIVSQDPTGYFQISGSNLEIKKELEYSSSSSHTVEVRVTDAGFNSTGDSLDRTATTTITVTVEDYDNLPPIFVQCEYASGVCVPPLYTVNISKNQVNSDLDSKIQPGKITAKDGDSGINATIVYSFINGVPSNYGDYFQIDPDTGTVSQTKEVSSISIFNIAVKATQANNAIQYAVTYLQIMVTEKDDYKPEFEDPSYKGEIVDNGDSILFVYIEGTKDLLRVVANDQDDNKTSLVYVVDPPYQITSEGNIFVQSSALTTRAAPPSSFTVKAINIDSQSTNRQSDPVTVTVAYTEVTTPNPTTTEMPTTTVEDTTTALDSTTAVDTTSITTPNPTTTAMDTTVSSTAEESTTAEVTTPNPTTVAESTTIEATTIATSLAPTTQAQSSQYTTNTVVDSTTVNEATSVEDTSFTTQTSSPNQTQRTVTAVEDSTGTTTNGDFTTITTQKPSSETQTSVTDSTTMLSSTQIPSNETQNFVSDSTMLFSTTNIGQTTNTAVSTAGTSPEFTVTVSTSSESTSDAPTQSTFDTTSVGDSPTANTADFTSSATQSSQTKTTASGTESSIPQDSDTTTKNPVSTATTSGNQNPIPTTSNEEIIDLDGMVSASLLYGVAGGLSAALFIAICIIIYLLYRQKNMKLEDTEPLVNPYPKKADQSNSTGSITHENQAYEEVDETQSNGDVSNSAKEDDSKVKMVGFVGATVVSDLNDVRDPSDASSLVSERSENTANEHHYEHLGDLEEERTVYMNTEFEKPEYENDYNRTDNNSLSNGHVLIEQSYPLETGDDDDIEVNSPSEFDDVPTNSFQDDIAKKAALVSAAIAATAVAAEASQPKENDVEEMKSNHKDILELSDDVIEVEAIIKDGLVSSTKIVTLKGLGEDGNDVKAVQKSLSTDMATTYDIHNWKEKLQVMAMLNELDHPNILKCHGQYEKDDCLHVAMAYAEHGSLKDYLKGHKELDANRLMYIIAGVGRGLQYLHAKNIVHGNLQARSVMLDANYNPMLTDIENTEVIQTDVGERNRWQALEVIDGQEKPTAISDVWSFGVLIWEIVSLGAVPYADVPSNMLAQHIKNSKLEKPEGCSESLYEIMESCWKDKATRLRPDIYEINAKISELLLEDSNDLIRLGFGEFGVDGKLSVEEQNLGGSTVWSRSSVSISEGSDAHTDYTAL